MDANSWCISLTISWGMWFVGCAGVICHFQGGPLLSVSGNGIKRCLSFLDTVLRWYLIAKTAHVNTRSVPSWSNHPGSFSFSHSKVSRFGNRFPFQVAVISADQPIRALEGWDKASNFSFKRGTGIHQFLEHYLEDHPMTIVLSERNHGDRCCPQDLGFWDPRTQMAKSHGFQMGVILTYDRHGRILQVVFQNPCNEWALELLSRPELFDSIWEA